jgi:7-carboxy-7-deazaguanine synthase
MTGAGRLPVIELFGPTIQGEGPDAGRPAHFVRFGGCDYRCTWCDTPYAVDPARVRAEARHLTVEQIAGELAALATGPTLVVLSGGNPALLELAPLVARLHADGYEVAVETQGSVWRDWLAAADRLVVSPKPPSSGMDDPERAAAVEAFLARVNGAGALKVVVFDEDDLAFAERLALAHPRLPLFLSAGTDQGLDEEQTRQRVLERLRWLCEATARRPALARARVAPQLHVLAWGTARAV